ncbi:Hypothetical predicted protein [Cloeon dipterum]|uniref:Uncharacterized protein n=1 Tax=Cloeon dipterum TaxID=197152 RepID=A0A8S1DQ89_9INSE|nr:Hypothetical predicted protein [Cloeon dipterum]
MDNNNFVVKFKSLPNNLRNRVLQVLTSDNLRLKNFDPASSCSKIQEFFTSLLNKETDGVDLGQLILLIEENYLSEGPSLVNLVNPITELAPNIKSLALNRRSYRAPCTVSSGILLERITTLKYLQTLDMPAQECQSSELMEMYRKLPNLTYLRIQTIVFGSNSNEIEELTSSFSHLKIFLLATLEDHNEKLTLLRKNCIMNLHEMEIVGIKATDVIHSACERLRFLPTKVSALRHLRTYPTSLQLREIFPNVTHLLVNCQEVQEEGDTTKLLQFTKIQSLNLKCFQSESIFWKFLEKYGKHLQSLAIHEVSFRIDLGIISDACPVLESLTLSEVVTSSPGALSFRELKKISWALPNMVGENIRLSSILSSPKLENVSLSNIEIGSDGEINLNLRDMKKLSTMISTNQILNALTCLSVNAVPNYNFRIYPDILKNHTITALRPSSIKQIFRTSPENTSYTHHLFSTMQFVCLVILAAVLLANSPVDAACDPKYAKYKNHVMCQNDTCVDGIERKRSGFSEIEKIAYLDTYNRMRSAVARGIIPAYPPATNMKELRWSDELEKVVQKLTDMCSSDPKDYALFVDSVYEKGGQHYTITSKYLGYPVDYDLSYNFIATFFLYTAFVNHATPAKMNQRRIRNKEKQDASDIFAVIAADAQYLACGITKWTSQKKSNMIAQNIKSICITAPGPILGGGKPFYEFGEPACDVPSIHYKGLCSTKEFNKMEFKRLPCHDAKFAKDPDTSIYCGDEQRFYDEIYPGIPYPYPYRCDVSSFKSRAQMFWWLTALLYTPLIPILLYKAVAFTWMDLASHFPNLHPFPSLKMLEKGNCASIQNVNAIKVDSRGRLWVVDRNWNCRSRIWIFDLNDNDEVVFVHDLPDYIFPYEYLGGTIVTMELHEEKDDTLAFIVDNNYESKVHVFSLKSKEMCSWERDKPGLYSVLVSDLIGRKNDSIIPSFIGNKSTNSYKLIMDRKGMLYYDVRDKNVLCSWDTNLPFKEEVVFEDDETIPDTRWDSRYTIDELDDVWLLARFDGGFKLFTSGVVAELVDRKFDNNEDTDDFVPYHVEHHLVLA